MLQALVVALLGSATLQAQVAGPVTIGPDEYAFQYTPSPGIGLFFNATDSRYELRDAAAAPAWWLNPQTDRAFFRGRVGIGTESPSVLLHVEGASRFGDVADFARIDQDGDLTFNGTADFLVGNDRYAFRAQTNENYGLFFNATDQRYQFMDGSASPIHTLGANGGFAVWYDEAGAPMLEHDGNNLTVSSLGVSSGLTLQGSDATTQVRVRLNNAMPGGMNYVLQSTANGTPIGGGKFSVRNENTGSNVLVIDSLGNLGVGTNTPFAKLDVAGAIRLADNTALPVDGVIRFNGTDFQGYDGSNWLSFTSGGNDAWSDAAIGDFSYRTGRLAVGTSSSGFTDDQVVIQTNGTVNPLRVRVGTATKFYVTGTGGVSVGSSFATPPTNGLYVAGDVTIGTQTPAAGYQLSVDGKIMCEELTVDLSGDWPDYVFTPTHARPALPELKAAIADLGHLPGIPSAAEVAEGGVHLGQMQAALLEKVEELTLYIIELEERLAEVEGR